MTFAGSYHIASQGTSSWRYILLLSYSVGFDVFYFFASLSNFYLGILTFFVK